MDTLQISMYKPVIVRKEVDDSHYYFVDGEYFPGVTTILDEAAPVPYELKQWFIKNSQEDIQSKKEEALGFGSKMHDAYEKLASGFELNLKENYRNTREKKHLASFVNWFNMYKPTVLNVEFTVAYKGTLPAGQPFCYAGTSDLLCIIEGETYLVDYKTSSAIRQSYEWQLRAYREAAELMGIHIDKTAILRTGTRHKDGFEFKIVDAPFSIFTNIYSTYLALHNGKIPPPPEIDVYPDTLKLDISKKIPVKKTKKVKKVKTKEEVNIKK